MEHKMKGTVLHMNIENEVERLIHHACTPIPIYFAPDDAVTILNQLTFSACFGYVDQRRQQRFDHAMSNNFSAELIPMSVIGWNDMRQYKSLVNQVTQLC